MKEKKLRWLLRGEHTPNGSMQKCITSIVFATVAAREYRQRYSNRNRFPDYRVFMRVHNAYMEGTLPGEHAARTGRPVVRFNNEEHNILRQLRLDPGISQRQISRNLGIPRSTVQLIIKKNNYHTYHVQRVQALLPADYEPRVRFCREMLRRHREDPQFFKFLQIVGFFKLMSQILEEWEFLTSTIYTSSPE